MKTEEIGIDLIEAEVTIDIMTEIGLNIQIMTEEIDMMMAEEVGSMTEEETDRLIETQTDIEIN